MGWSADTCILSFRGTSSFTNVLADLQVASIRAASSAQHSDSLVLLCKADFGE